MSSATAKKLLIISNVEQNAFYKHLCTKLGFESDPRIVFAGTLYDSELLKKVRENAFAYLHGHSVGGTNPSLLEALASTKINLLFDVPFNREVGESQCLYFSDEPNSLSSLISRIEKEPLALTSRLNSIQIIHERFSWELIISLYERLFVNVVG